MSIPAPTVGPRTLTRIPAIDEIAAVRAIGETPLLPLARFAADAQLPDTIRLRIKAEWVNPGGSIKDRTALSIVRQAITDGKLGRGQALLDATSGNTGIAYAMLGAALGIPVHLVVPGSASEERKRTLAAYGATVTYSDPYEGSDGAIRLVRAMAASDPDAWCYADQYANPANVLAHFTTTGPEIWRQTAGCLTHFVAALGTTGTLMGVGRFLRERSSARLVGVQPASAFHGIEGLKHLPTAIVPAIFDPALPDEIVGVETEEAFDAARRLARLEGLFVGSSSGANLAAAVRLGQRLAHRGESADIVVVGCDGGGRYLSTGLWDVAPPQP